MNKAQKRLILFVLPAIALILHAYFCEWGNGHTNIVQMWSTESTWRTIKPRQIVTDVEEWYEDKRPSTELNSLLASAFHKRQCGRTEPCPSWWNLTYAEVVQISFDHRAYLAAAKVAKVDRAYVSGDYYGIGSARGVSTDWAIGFGIALPVILLAATLFLHLGWRKPQANEG